MKTLLRRITVPPVFSECFPVTIERLSAIVPDLAAVGIPRSPSPQAREAQVPKCSALYQNSAVPTPAAPV